MELIRKSNVKKGLQGLFPVPNHMKLRLQLGSLEAFANQSDVSGRIFYDQDFNVVLFRYDHFQSFLFGKVKKKVAPELGWDSTQIRPPCRSTMRLQIASPIPVPEYSSR